MTTIEITRVEDVRAGDVVTFADSAGGTYVGPARRAALDPTAEQLYFGPAGSGWPVMHRYSLWTFVRATREVPDLPTKPGSVIVNVTAPGPGFKGVAEYPYGVLKCEGLWRLFTADGRFGDRGANEIGAWTPARIVPEDGAS